MKQPMCEYCEEFKPVCKWYDRQDIKWIICIDCLEDLKDDIEAKERRDNENI